MQNISNSPFLTKTDINQLSYLINQIPKHITEPVNKIWYLMDKAWDELECNNKKLDWSKISKFYDHPVWTLNGIFIEQDKISMDHRYNISKYVIKNNFKKILDYGSGFGTLSRIISDANKTLNIDIFEPHPSELSKLRSKQYENITIISELNEQYDCIIAQDVLEHLSDPLRTLEQMIKHTKYNGYLVLANCFYPVIKCHLPRTFHLRYFFSLYAKLMGLKKIGKVENCGHAIIYKKVSQTQPNWILINVLTKLTKLIYPLLNITHLTLKKLKVGKIIKSNKK